MENKKKTCKVKSRESITETHLDNLSGGLLKGDFSIGGHFDVITGKYSALSSIYKG